MLILVTSLLLQAGLARDTTVVRRDSSAADSSRARAAHRLEGMQVTAVRDGIPLNEPEDQGLFFSNFPDFANSIASVEVQRGVGSSSHGVAAYAGSVSFESVAVAGAPRGAELQLTRGDYNTSRASVVLQSGLTERGLAGYLRASGQTTDGYRYNSGNRSRGAFASGGWFGGRDAVKATLLAGVSSNEQAYLASPLSVLDREPRDNPYGNSRRAAVTDRFHQGLASLAWTRARRPP